MATNVNIETGLIGVTPKYKFHDQVTVNTGDTIQDVSWSDCEYLAKFKKNSLGSMIVRPDYIYEDTAGNLARNGVTIVGVSTENTLARVTDPEVLRVLLDNVSHTLEGQIRLAEVASGSIGAAWFAGNTKIEVFDCPRGYSVAASAFNGCTGLKEVFIQKNVSLGNSAFNGCSHVECYHFLDTNVGSFGTTVFAGLSGTCYLYVPNESVVNYCKVSNLGTYINRIRGHIKGWHLICADGTYKYNLRDCYDTATNISFRLEGTYVTNLSLSVDPDTYEATVTVTGMLPDTDEDVELVYGFDYRNHHFSGYVPLHLKTGAAEIIEFEDPEVKRICVANWGGIYRMSLDGYEDEMTKEQAAKVSSIGTQNTGTPWKDIRSRITSFNEFRYFTQITTLPGNWAQAAGGVFQGCTRMTSVQLPPNLSVVNDNSFRGCTALVSLMLPETVTTLQRGCFRDMKCPVILLSTTPPSLNTYDNQNTCTFYVHNESIVTYRGASVWSGLKSRIHGFFDMPPIIIKDGTYTMTLRDIFDGYSDLQVLMEENDYLTLSSVEDNIATIVASGITPSTDSTAAVSYSFVYKGSTISGTINIQVIYKETITFEDAEAKRICVANWGGEYCASTDLYGMKGEITMEQAGVVTSIGTIFRSNTIMKSFDELNYFINVKSLAEFAFSGCSALRSVGLANITSAGRGAFGASGLYYAWLPNLGTCTFSNSASNGQFYNTKSLKAVLFDSITSIDGVFYNSTVQYIIITSPNIPARESSTAFPSKVYVPDSFVPLYQANTSWSNRNIIPLSHLPKDYPDCPWLEDLSDRGLLPDYIDFEDAEVKRICCVNWGDYTKKVITETVTEEEDTVSINTVYTFVSKVNSTTTQTILQTTESSRAKTEDDVAGETSTTTNYPVGLTKTQAATVSSIGTAMNGHNEFYDSEDLYYISCMINNVAGLLINHNSANRYGVNNSSYFSTKYIKVSPYDSLTVTLKGGEVILYRKDFVYTDYWSGDNRTVALTANCYWARVSFPTNQTDNVYVKNNTTGEYIYKGANVP